MNGLELNKKLAEWLGWEFREDSYRVYSGASGWGHISSLPNFSQSLDACRRYLFPKLWSDNKLWEHFVELARWEGSPPNHRRLKDGEMGRHLLDPMFICQIIEKLIDESAIKKT